MQLNIFNTKNDILRLEIGLTNTCNLKCPLCIRQTHPNLLELNTKHRSAEEILAQIDEYKNLKYITIAGSTSEPTLHPELFTIIEHLINRNIEISLFINGDTHDDNYYRKLGLLFRRAKGNIYFTMCGSTQELHEKYRVGSSLETVLRRTKLTMKYTNNVVLTWIIFNYNEEDFNTNKHIFDIYNLESFHTLPIQEHFNVNDVISKGIHLPDKLHDIYKSSINKNDVNDIVCPAVNYKFELFDFSGKTNPCSLYALFGDKHCFECSINNTKILKENMIYHIAEPEDESSEMGLRL